MEYFAHSQKAFLYKYVVMLSDIDQFKHMSFANYLKLMFLAADALFIGVLDNAFLQKWHIRLETSRMQFKRQTVFGDNILIKVNSSDVGDSGFSLLFTFVIEGSGELIGLGKQRYCFYDLRNMTITHMSGEIRGTLEPIKVNEPNLLYKY